MKSMFERCNLLHSLDVSSFNTANVTDMSRMFMNCENVKSLETAGFSTAKVTDMSQMFSGCSALTQLDVSGFNTSKVTAMNDMFFKCYGLSALDVSGFNTSKVTNMYGMFSNCSALTSLDVSGFSTSNVTDMRYMFRSTDSLTTLDVSGFNTSKVTDMYGMFNGSGVTSLDLSGFNMSKVTNIGGMFFDCHGLVNLDVSGWDTTAIKNMEYVFMKSAVLKELDLSSWDTSGVESYEAMFDGCSGLEQIKLGEKYKIKDANMFPNATSTLGNWWSTKDSTWIGKADIVSSRSNIADTYSAFAGGEYRISLSDAVVTLDKTTYGWTGEEIKPKVTVKAGELILSEGTDFALEFKNNVNVGTATVTVKGIGSFTDSKDVQFNISYEAVFKDVDDQVAHVEDIIWLANTGISQGWIFEDGSREFRPYASVARADMAAFLFRLAARWGVVDNNWEPSIDDTKIFADVDFDTPHSREIRWLASAGISTGWDRPNSAKKEFRPYAFVARQDMAAFLFRLAKLANKGGASDKWTADADARARFVDMDGNDDTNHHNEVWWLAQTGVSQGWDMGNGIYECRGLQSVARADMAAFLHRMDGVK